jgi:hypothetical protein
VNDYNMTDFDIRWVDRRAETNEEWDASKTLLWMDGWDAFDETWRGAWFKRRKRHWPEA